MTNAIDTGFCSYRTIKEKNLLILQQFLINLNKNIVSRTDLVYTTNSCTYSLCIFLKNSTPDFKIWTDHSNATLK